MNVLWPIVLVTFKEGARNRAFYGISLLAIVLLGANPLIASMVTHNIGKVATDVALSFVSFSGLLLVVFIGINIIAKDLDRRTIYMVLSRPVSRTQYLLGKFLGLSLLVVLAMSILSVLTVISLASLKTVYPNYFERFSWALIFLSLVFIALMLILLSAISLFFASFSSSSFITLVLTIITYLIGQSISDIKTLVEAPQAAGIEVSSLSRMLIRIAYVLFPNLSLFDIKIQAAHGIMPSMQYICYVVLYGVAYTLLLIAAAAWIFRKKEFP